MSKLVLMGSGETAPSLVGVHRQLLASLPNPHCCWLDTPYGFQENADILSAKTVEFYQQSLHQKLNVAHFRSSEQPEVERQLCYTLVRSSNLIFAGPGSPSYTQLHWSKSELPQIFIDKLHQEDSVVIFASAAACAVGALCLPVYEIYKVGADPHWLPGLEILSALGFAAVVLPHYNNTTGGNHDTRFCYLGERRLARLESQLEDGLWIWGVDEHTAVILDLALNTFEVHGKGGFTLRLQGRSTFFESGYHGSLQELRQPGTTDQPAAATAPVAQAGPTTQGLITEVVKPMVERFDYALHHSDGLGAAQALLDFEQVLVDWSGDSDVHHWQMARAQFRNLLAQIGDSAQRGLQDPSQPIAPFVQTLLDLREQAREEREFQRADQIRQRLLKSGVDVQDTPQGTRWALRPEAMAL
ncbi:hypothetical protein IV102_04305 [bacterium]|nr:hypothetical protein [bacterium]